MITSLVFSTISQSQTEPLTFPEDLMRGAAYQAKFQPDPVFLDGDGYFQSSMFFVAPDYSRLTIHVFWTKHLGQKKYLPINLGSKEGEKYRLGRFNVTPPGFGTFSGEPPKFAGFKLDKSGVLNYIDSTWASAGCEWSPPRIDNGTQYWESAPFDAEAKSAFVEKIARHTLIRAAGLRLDPVETINTTSAAKCRLTQAKFVDLTKWAELNGWKIGDENEYGIITLKKGEIEAVLPLGADQIKVKGVWKEMGDSAAFFNGKLYLPAAGLEHLRGAKPSFFDEGDLLCR